MRIRPFRIYLRGAGPWGLLALSFAGLQPAHAQRTPTAIPNLRHFEWQNPPLTGYPLADLCALDSLTAYAAGQRGTVVKTTDGGRSWRVLNTGTRNAIVSISFSDARHGWVTYHTPITNLSIQTLVYAGKGEARYTADGGLTWVRRPFNTPNTSERPWSIQAISATEAIVTGEGGRCDPRFPCGGLPPVLTLRTTNAGRTWQNLSSNSLYNSWGYEWQMQYFTPTSWLCSKWPNPWTSGVARTDNGGLSLKLIGPDTTDGGMWYKQAQFFDLQHGWILGSSSRFGPFAFLYRTRDGGRTWSPPDTINFSFPPNAPSLANLKDMVFTTPAMGVAFDRFNLYTTLDSGRTWAQQPFVYWGLDPAAGRLRAAPDGSVWLIEAQTAQVWRTRAVGQPWRQVTTTQAPTMSKILFTYDPIIRAPQFLDARHGWAMASKDSALLRTTDRGRHWQRVPVPKPPVLVGTSLDWRIKDFDFVDPDTGYVCVVGRWVLLNTTIFCLLRTTDGGRTWATSLLPSGILMNTDVQGGIDFVTANRGVFVTEKGAIWCTQDGGQTWTAPSSGTRYQLFVVRWQDPLTAYIKGANSVFVSDTTVLLKTTDGGVSWSLLSNTQFGGTGNIGVQPGGLLTSGSYYTRDDGATVREFFVDSVTQLAPEIPPFHGNFVSVSFRNARHGLAFGVFDFYRTTNGGASWQRFASPGGSNYPAPVHGSAVDDYNAWMQGSFSEIMHYSEKYIQTDTAAGQPRAFCTTDTLTVAFDTIGVFSATERSFRVELSNKMGRFRPNETTILPLVGTGAASPLRAVLPATLAAGTRYRLRVIRADSSVLGGDNERDLTIYPRPAAVAVAPTDSARFCAGDSVLLTAPAGFAAYAWSGGATTAAIWVRAAGTYTVRVAAGGGCFGPASRPVTVRVTPRPAAPVLTPTGGGPVLLTAVPALPGATYAWTGPGGVVAGASGPLLLLTAAAQNGFYSVTVTARGCVSPASASVLVRITGLGEEADRAGLTLSPNPATTAVTLRSAAGVREATVLDAVGRVVRRRTVAGSQAADPELTVPLAGLPAGLYQVQATLGDGRIAHRRLLIER